MGVKFRRMSCCSALTTFCTRFSGLIIMITGLAVMGYGFWMVDMEVNGLSIFVVVFGAYTAFVGSIGTCVSCMQTAKRCTSVFLFFLGIAVVFEMAIGIALKADKAWAENFFVGETCGNLNTTKCNEQVKKAEDFFDSHENFVFYIL